MKPADYVPVAHLCPAIDRLASIVRRHVEGAERAEALALLSEVRAGATALRGNAGAWERVARGQR